MLKQIIGSTAIFILLIVCSISDFDISAWHESQPEPCLEFEIPENLTDGSDSSWAIVSNLMLRAIDIYGVDCLEVVNHDFRVITRDEIEYLVALDGAPETRSLEDIPCEECPFLELHRCPKCVEIHNDLEPD